MARTTTRRDFVRKLGIGGAALPFILNLPSLGFANQGGRKQRLVVVFSPNGVVQKNFWADEPGPLTSFKPSLEPLEPFRDRTLLLKGVCNKIKGDGDGHMRGIGCLLTGVELFPGNIQGGSDTPAGWASGLSIDQEIANFLQASEATRTRFGSLEFGVMVPERADTWTRMSYAGPNKPLSPIDDPYQMFNKLYGRLKDQESLKSILDDLQDDLKKVRSHVSVEDRRLLDEHAEFVRAMELQLSSSKPIEDVGHAVPELDPGLDESQNDQMPEISKAQIDLLVNSFAADFNRVATLQYTNSVGQAKMRWVGVEEGHHELSHEPNSNDEAQEKLTKINHWFAEQIAYLAKRLDETPEPGGEGTMLDNTTIVWTNELGAGNSHTRNDIPFVLVGGGLNYRMGRAVHYDRVNHNRLLMSFAHAFGHHIDRFGNPDYCGEGTLPDLT